METIPLFPLNSILFPKGRISLQIFESRYMDMIRQCLKDQSGFGVVLIEKGTEVALKGKKLDIHRIGTYSTVVDWNQLPNGLLGITVEGSTTFKIIESWREEDDLCRAEVVFREHDSLDSDPVDVGEQFKEYVNLLHGLAKHSAVEELNLDISFDNLREIAWRLSELLPITNLDKQALLELTDPFDRLEQIEIYINSLEEGG